MAAEILALPYSRWVFLFQVGEEQISNHFLMLVLGLVQEEMKLEKDIAKIETYWRSQALEMSRYKTDDHSYVLRANEEMRMTLEDHILQLQSMTGSRFAVVVMERIKKWERTLNTIREVFEAWLQVGTSRLRGRKTRNNQVLLMRGSRCVASPCWRGRGLSVTGGCKPRRSPALDWAARCEVVIIARVSTETPGRPRVELVCAFLRSKENGFI